MAFQGFFDLNRTDNRRALGLLAVGAVTGLAIAGFGLFTAKGTSTFVVPAEDVALVNQRPVSRYDFEAQIKAVFDVSPGQATPAQKKKVLDDMIREELFVQRGVELDMPGVDPEVRAALVLAVEQQIAAEAFTRIPPDTQLRAFYEKNRGQYSTLGTMAVADLVAPDQAKAATAIAALKSGASPKDAAARFGLRETGKVNGEEFDFAAKIHLGDALFKVAETLPQGGVSEPVVQPDGVHILVMGRRVAPKPTPFEGARDQVLADYRRDAKSKLDTSGTGFLRKRANILIAPDLR